MGIRGKILSIAAALLIIGIVAEALTCGYIFSKEYSKALKSSALSMGESLRSQLDRILSLGIPLNELVGFEKQCQELVARNKDIDYAMVVDLNGRILFSSNSSQNGERIGTRNSESANENEDAFLPAGDQDTYEVLIPVVSGQDRQIAAIHVGVSARTINDKVDRLVKYTIMVSVAALGVLIFLLLLTLGKWVTEPLSELFETIQRLRRDEAGFYSKLAVPYKGEIGQVSTAIDNLIDDLNASHKMISTHAEKLELTVEKRTTELKALNEQLTNDIEERKKIENALREREAFIRAIMDNLPTGIAVNTVQPVVRFVYMNDNFPRFYRTTREAISDPDAFWEAVYEEPEFRAKIKQKVLDDCTSGDPERMYWTDVPIVRAGQPTCFISTRNVLLPDKNLSISIVWDVTERMRADEERRKLEERLQRAEKMEALGTLAGGVAHELNNVLGIVVGFSELLLYDLEESSQQRSLAEEILKGGQRAAAIIQDMLILARRGVPSRTILNVNKVLTVYRKSPEFEKLCSSCPKVQIQADLDPDLLNIAGSTAHLEKSLINLVSHAAKAMGDGGIISIKTRNQYLDKPILGYDEVKEGDYVVLSVSDNGEGISPNHLKRIFEPFYTKKVMGRSGTGLGLAVVWGTVMDHNGYINVESMAGKGTTFTLYFPVAREEITPEQISVAVSEYVGKGESILVVDDVKEQRDLAAAILEKINYRVAAVSSGEEAIEYLMRHNVDLMVLDMIMDRGMDGLDTYSRVSEIRPGQKAIIVSGFAETDRVSRALAMGAGAYVKKPYVLEKLAMAVRKELDRA